MFEMSSEMDNGTKNLRILSRFKKWELSTTGSSKLFL